MTRKKAIETAMDESLRQMIANGDASPFGSRESTLLAWISSGRAYDMGRIAGLREAARMTIRHDGGWTPMVGMVQRKARALAKNLKDANR